MTASTVTQGSLITDIANIIDGGNIQDFNVRNALTRIKTALTDISTRRMSQVAASTATTAGSLVTDFNLLITELRLRGYMD